MSDDAFQQSLKSWGEQGGHEMKDANWRHAEAYTNGMGAVFEPLFNAPYLVVVTGFWTPGKRDPAVSIQEHIYWRLMNEDGLSEDTHVYFIDKFSSEVRVFEFTLGMLNPDSDEYDTGFREPPHPSSESITSDQFTVKLKEAISQDRGTSALEDSHREFIEQIDGTKNVSVRTR